MKKSEGMINVPLAISSQMINYNLPGLNDKNLNLTGPVLAGIYSGKITMWDDAQLKAMNPGVDLPHQTIIPIHRTDGSGDTFIFSQYLAFNTTVMVEQHRLRHDDQLAGGSGRAQPEGNLAWSMPRRAIRTRSPISASASRTRPAQRASARRCCRTRPASSCWRRREAVSAAVAATSNKTPTDERVSLIFAEGDNSYPIINYEYAIVKAQQPAPEMVTAVARVSRMGDQAGRRQCGEIHGRGRFRAAAAGNRQAERHAACIDEVNA